MTNRKPNVQTVLTLTQVSALVHGDQPGHIAQDCMAHFADSSMQARFPKREKVQKSPIKYYECRHCGGSHPFNIYCPNVRDPPVVPGECRSCGITTREHANDCQYVAIKDNIGLCTYCRAQDHRYAACPQRLVDQGAVNREKSKNKKNKRKRKVRIVAGIMTREQDSDLTTRGRGRTNGRTNTWSTKERGSDVKSLMKGTYKRSGDFS